MTANGHTKKSVNALPSILNNKSCVAVADVNKDGSNDILVEASMNTKKPVFNIRSGFPAIDGEMRDMQ